MTETPTTADGVVETRGDLAVIRFERRLAHPVERVWTALTDPAELVRWWGDAEVDLVEGGRFTIRWLNEDEDGNAAVMNATITHLEPPAVLELRGDIHGDLRWELAAEGSATVLRFSSTLELPDEFRTRTIAGWHTHLDALAITLDGGEVDLVNIEVMWQPIHERYVAEAGEGGD